MKGYRKIAALMGTYPSLRMVSQLSSLNIQSLLYQQAELIGLQADLAELEDQNDASSDSERSMFCRDFSALSEAEDVKDRQWLLILEIREKLKAYNEAVVLYNSLASIPAPASHELEEVQDWMRRPTRGNVYLLGRDRHVWSEGKDLVSLQGKAYGGGGNNKLARWIIGTLTPVYHNTFGRYYKKTDLETAKFAPNTVHYSDSTIIQVVSFFVTLVASLLPICAILVLYVIVRPVVRLGLVALFTAIFSICVWFMTDGRLVENFASTSTFAAVQVVFVSTSTNITSNGV